MSEEKETAKKTKKQRKFELMFAPYVSPTEMGGDKKLQAQFEQNRRGYASLGENGWELIALDRISVGGKGAILIFQREILD